MDGLDEFIGEIEREKREIDKEIAVELREQSKVEEQMHGAVQEQKKLVEELVHRIAQIKSKAEISENQVKTICSDIKNLDNAKKNLTWTISALKKQMMLITAISQLRRACVDKRYKEAAKLIEATGDLLKTFEDYRSVTQIQQIKAERDHLCQKLEIQIKQELDLYAQLNNP